MFFRFAIFVGLGSVVATIIYLTPVPGEFLRFLNFWVITDRRSSTIYRSFGVDIFARWSKILVIYLEDRSENRRMTKAYYKNRRSRFRTISIDRFKDFSENLLCCHFEKSLWKMNLRIEAMNADKISLRFLPPIGSCLQCEKKFKLLGRNAARWSMRKQENLLRCLFVCISRVSRYVCDTSKKISNGVQTEMTRVEI